MKIKTFEPSFCKDTKKRETITIEKEKQTRKQEISKKIRLIHSKKEGDGCISEKKH
jgi:hypothetical protein